MLRRARAVRPGWAAVRWHQVQPPGLPWTMIMQASGQTDVHADSTVQTAFRFRLCVSLLGLQKTAPTHVRTHARTHVFLHFLPSASGIRIPTRPSARPVGTASHNRTLWRNSTAAQVHEICTALPFVRYFLLTQEKRDTSHAAATAAALVRTPELGALACFDGAPAGAQRTRQETASTATCVGVGGARGRGRAWIPQVHTVLPPSSLPVPPF
ncbi:hypothetical protein PCL_06017 [Purpureocillium lilacinum]|nr:hypothetical protein PCL_06017 [Purpureocillium lilacinum]